MPLYEYECKTCGERTEAIQRSDDPLLTVCPRCGGALRKLLSAPAFRFKGSGFYVTDYGKAGEKKNGEKETSSSKGEEGKGAGNGAPSGGEAGETKKEDSSKGKKDRAGDGGASAAPSSPAGAAPPAPSKKKDTDRK